MDWREIGPATDVEDTMAPKPDLPLLRDLERALRRTLGAVAEFRRAAEHHRWCWTCGTTESECTRHHSSVKCCPECQHQGMPGGLVDIGTVARAALESPGQPVTADQLVRIHT